MFSFSDIFVFFILIYSVILHEIAHGYIADWLGDPTARLAGRLTLDPRVHIDPIMTIVLPLILFLSHVGVVFGAAKPVPVDSFNFREPKKDLALVALAGPATNLLIALLFGLLFRLTTVFILDQTLLNFLGPLFGHAAILNIGLAVFNLFPLPPLDGFKVLIGVLPNQVAQELTGLERVGFILIFFILFFIPGLIFNNISPIINTLAHLFLGS